MSVLFRAFNTCRLVGYLYNFSCSVDDFLKTEDIFGPTASRVMDNASEMMLLFGDHAMTKKLFLSALDEMTNDPRMTPMIRVLGEHVLELHDEDEVFANAVTERLINVAMAHLRCQDEGLDLALHCLLSPTERRPYDHVSEKLLWTSIGLVNEFGMANPEQAAKAALAYFPKDAPHIFSDKILSHMKDAREDVSYLKLRLVRHYEPEAA